MAKLSRRNTIIGLGALVGGTGALAASGAFTTVEAERAVDIETSGDDNALVQLSVDGILAGDENDVIAFDQDNFNLQAITTLEATLYVAIDAAADDFDYEVDILTDFGGDSITYNDGDEDDSADPDNIVQFVANDGESSDGVNWSGGAARLSTDGDSNPDSPVDDYAVYDVVINLREYNDESAADTAIGNEIGDNVVIEVTSI